MSGVSNIDFQEGVVQRLVDNYHNGVAVGIRNSNVMQSTLSTTDDMRAAKRRAAQDPRVARARAIYNNRIAQGGDGVHPYGI